MQLSHLGSNETALGFKGSIFNITKHPLTVKKLNSDYNKHYEDLYHKAMKTAHLECIDVYFIAPSFTWEARQRAKQLKEEVKIIKRPGCNPCSVNYKFISYEKLVAHLLAQAPDTAARTFVINYGRNV